MYWPGMPAATGRHPHMCPQEHRGMNTYGAFLDQGGGSGLLNVSSSVLEEAALRGTV